MFWKNKRWKTEAAFLTYADPRMFESLVGRDPFGGVDRQHLIDQVLGLGGHSVPLWGGKLEEEEEEERYLLYLLYRI